MLEVSPHVRAIQVSVLNLKREYFANPFPPHGCLFPGLTPFIFPLLWLLQILPQIPQALSLGKYELATVPKGPENV